MKSRISIEIDFDNGNEPFLQVLSRNSDDVRDKLISQFIENLGYDSTWCKIQYDNEFSDENGRCKRWKIKPIGDKQVLTESALMSFANIRSSAVVQEETETTWDNVINIITGGHGDSETIDNLMQNFYIIPKRV